MTILDYPRWRHLIVDLTEDQFLTMWREQFEWSFYECECMVECGYYTIETPNEVHRFSDWHYEYTDQPVLGADGQILIRGNIRYAYDLIGQPYWLLDPKTGYPRNFEAIVRIEMIKRYLKTNNL